MWRALWLTLRLRGFVWRRILSPVLRLLLPGRGLLIGKGLEIYGFPIFQIAKGGSIDIGECCTLCSLSDFSALGTRSKVIMRVLNPEAKIIIGDNCGMSGTTICASESVIVGSGVLFGADVKILDTDFHPKYSSARYQDSCPKGERIVIEDNVFLGTGAQVLKGVTIGRNSIVAAGSVVTRSVAANTIVGGNPARVIGILEMAC